MATQNNDTGGLPFLTYFNFLMAFGLSWLSWFGIEALWEGNTSLDEKCQIIGVWVLNALFFFGGVGLLLRRRSRRNGLSAVSTAPALAGCEAPAPLRPSGHPPWTWWVVYLIHWVMGYSLGAFAIFMFIVTVADVASGGNEAPFSMVMIFPFTVCLPGVAAFILVKGAYYMKRPSIQELFGNEQE